MTTFKEIEIPARRARYYLSGFSHSVEAREVNVSIGIGSEVDGQVVMEPGSVRNVRISGEDYDELLSASPEWAPGKPAGKFRPEDLLAFVFIVESRHEGEFERNRITRQEQEKQAQVEAEKRRAKRQELIDNANEETRQALKAKRQRVLERQQDERVKKELIVQSPQRQAEKEKLRQQVKSGINAKALKRFGEKQQKSTGEN